MEKGCRRAGPVRVRPMRFVVQLAEGSFLQVAVTKTSVRARQNRSLLPEGSRRVRQCSTRKGRVAGEESLSLARVEPTVHVPARLERRDHLLGHRDLLAVAWVSPGARLARLDRENSEA